MEIFIYVLKNPITGEIKYVGKTNNPKRRLYSHIEESKRKTGLKNRRVINWINSLLKDKLKPKMEIVEICNNNNWEEKEIYWINYYRNIGIDLCNIENGGKHSEKKFSDKTKSIHANNLRKLRSKYSENEKIYIWDLICNNTKDSEIQKLFPEISKSFLYQVKNGYKWNHITNLPKGKSIKRPFRKFRGKGYSFSKKIKKWLVIVSIDKKRVVIGRFTNEESAHTCIEEYRNSIINKQELPNLHSWM